ncbi:RNA polymerase sigma factor (sigma-70 family) [Actinokineospora auranticolor]|uniref:RNA polymerase sigma factor n=1 Tax=Actinokineospora auranticolor TaxID=155976 RepID=A0A2S6GDC9_9PSEU|nr:RNA polymerase sigma factor (sigma-70 family) [Actinokineospora auranticolor]
MITGWLRPSARCGWVHDVPAADPPPADPPANRAVEAVWRIEAARLIAGLARVVRDVGRAEDLAQDALVAALEQWPASGIPDNPGAWLMAVAKRRAVDGLRREVRLASKVAELGRDLATVELDLDVEDDVLRLMFTACHPVLTPPARAALTLKMLAGLRTEEIARAFLVPTPTMAQRIVRAKKTLADARVPFEVPTGAELSPRLASVLGVVYLLFNEGYSATAGPDLLRPALCDEAMRLGRILAALAPHEPEAHGLLALMELQASRLRSRTDATGEIVTLLDQDRTRWDRLLIGRGLSALDRAVELGGETGKYAVQAAIAACHARAHTADDTDWGRIADLYGVLAQVAPSPVIELNRAVAVSMADGPAAALALVDALVETKALARYHLLPAVRADLLVKLARPDEARAEFERAAALTDNNRERDLLLTRAKACDATPTG